MEWQRTPLHNSLLRGLPEQQPHGLYQPAPHMLTPCVVPTMQKRRHNVPPL